MTIIEGLFHHCNIDDLVRYFYLVLCRHSRLPTLNVPGPVKMFNADLTISGIIILINFFLAVALTGQTFITEKRDGLLDRFNLFFFGYF